MKTIVTLLEHEPTADIFLVDDCSPDKESLEDVVLRYCRARSVRYVLKEENTGFSSTVNVGLRRALALERDAVLVNADIEFVRPVSQTMIETTDSRGHLAAVVGALLLYPSGQIQHSGIYVSLLDRSFDHRYRYGPGGLPEAHQQYVCPVTGALQFIRLSTLQTVGLYDEVGFRLGFEDVDYCLRVFEADLECVYNPDVLAIHHESLFRGSRSEKIDEWHQSSLRALHEKHGQTSLGRYVPPIA